MAIELYYMQICIQPYIEPEHWSFPIIRMLYNSETIENHTIGLCTIKTNRLTNTTETTKCSPDSYCALYNTQWLAVFCVLSWRQNSCRSLERIAYACSNPHPIHVPHTRILYTNLCCSTTTCRTSFARQLNIMHHNVYMVLYHLANNGNYDTVWAVL